MKISADPVSGSIKNPAPERVTIGELLGLLIKDYSDEKKRTLYDLKGRVEKHLRPRFGHMKTMDLTTKGQESAGECLS